MPSRQDAHKVKMLVHELYLTITRLVDSSANGVIARCCGCGKKLMIGNEAGNIGKLTLIKGGKSQDDISD